MRLILPLFTLAKLPHKINLGYSTNCEKVQDFVLNGGNVIVWSFISFDIQDSKPIIRGLDYKDCIGETISEINAKGYQVVNLVSTGGWNGPHPPKDLDAASMYAVFKRWNSEIKGFDGFDGIDWDLEGNDDMNSKYNKFTPKVLKFMGEFSILAKKDGYIVSLVPAESYFDSSTSEFDLDLRHTYPEWLPQVPNFKYHGRNPYAYVYSRYFYAFDNVPTFDFVMLQVYETWSHMLFNTTFGQSAGEYLTNLVSSYANGWKVDFSLVKDLNYPDTMVSVPPDRFVLGLANGWADGVKTLFLSESELTEAANQLQSVGTPIKGFGFWVIQEEGKRHGDTQIYYGQIISKINSDRFENQ